MDTPNIEETIEAFENESKIDDTQEMIDKKLIKELEDKIVKMEKDKDDKLKSAKEQLIENLEITADKYRTATGVMEALRVMRMVNDGRLPDMEIYDEINEARDIAATMITQVSKLVHKAKSLSYEDMDKLCEDAYEEDFVSNGFNAIDLAIELMRLDLCRNIGPAAEDIIEFSKHAEEEIKNTVSELDKLYKKYPKEK